MPEENLDTDLGPAEGLICEEMRESASALFIHNKRVKRFIFQSGASITQVAAGKQTGTEPICLCSCMNVPFVM